MAFRAQSEIRPVVVKHDIQATMPLNLTQPIVQGHPRETPKADIRAWLSVS